MSRKDAVERIGKYIDIGDTRPLPLLIEQENESQIHKHERKKAARHRPHFRAAAKRSVQGAGERDAIHDPCRPSRMIGNEERQIAQRAGARKELVPEERRLREAIEPEHQACEHGRGGTPNTIAAASFTKRSCLEAAITSATTPKKTSTMSDTGAKLGN